MTQTCGYNGCKECAQCATTGPEILTPAHVQAELRAKAEAFRQAQGAAMLAMNAGVAEAARIHGLAETTPRGERYFARSEVVAALRTLKTTVDNFNAHEALDCAIRAFQRME